MPAMLRTCARSTSSFRRRTRPAKTAASSSRAWRTRRRTGAPRRHTAPTTWRCCWPTARSITIRPRRNRASKSCWPRLATRNTRPWARITAAKTSWPMRCWASRTSSTIAHPLPQRLREPRRCAAPTTSIATIWHCRLAGAPPGKQASNGNKGSHSRTKTPCSTRLPITPPTCSPPPPSARTTATAPAARLPSRRQSTGR